jgi:hypothetical protein
MANTYTYSGPATRWSEGDPTAVDYLNVSRVNADHLYEALNTIINTATITAGAATALKDGTAATTQSPGNDTTKVATTAFVKAAVDASSTSPGGSNTQVQYNNSGAFGASANLTFDGNDLFIADGGGMVIGHTSQLSPVGYPPELQVLGTGDADTQLALVRYSNSSSGTQMSMTKSRATSVGGSNVIVQDGDQLGLVSWQGDDGTTLDSRAASIDGFVDGAPGVNQMPGRLEFMTNSGASGTGPVTRMTIASDGNIGISTTSPSRDLQISKSAAGDVALKVANTNTATGADRPGVLQLSGGVNADWYNQGRVEFQYLDTTISSIIGVNLGSTSGTGRGGGLRFFTKSDNGTNTSRMFIDQSGGIWTDNAGCDWYYAGNQTVGTSYEDVDTSLFPTFLQRDRAYLLYWVSYANHNGDTSSRQYGLAWVSGNAHGGSTNWRATVTVLGSNTSGYHGYANLTFANGADGNLDVKRSSSSQQSYVNYWVQSACNTGTV